MTVDSLLYLSCVVINLLWIFDFGLFVDWLHAIITAMGNKQ